MSEHGSMDQTRCYVCGNLTRFCPCPSAAPPDPGPAPVATDLTETWGACELLAEWEKADYNWWAVGLFRRSTDGALFIATDAGCSCYYAWEQAPTDAVQIANDSDGWAAIVEKATGTIDDDADTTEFLRTAAMALRDGWVLADGTSTPISEGP